jgi:hypothetical protein
MCLGIVGNLVTHAGHERELASILKFGLKVSFDTEKDVAFDAPMVGNVPRRILDAPYANRSKVSHLCVRFFAASPSR